MIAVFVREENSIDAFEGFADGGEERGEFSGGETGIDEHAGAFRDEQRRVTGTAAAKNTKTHRHVVRVLKTRAAGNAKQKSGGATSGGVREGRARYP